MSLSIPGIKGVLRCDLGTLGTTPTHPFYSGISEPIKMGFKNFKSPKNRRDSELRNMKQGEISYASLQPTLQRLKSCIDHANMNCDVQLLTDKQSSTADSEDVLKFTASSFLLGLAFKYELSLEKIILTETLKGAASYQTVKALIDSGDSETLVAVTGITHPAGEDQTQYHEPNIMALESPLNTALFTNLFELDDLKLIIESMGKDTGYGQATMDEIKITLSVTGRDASVSKIVALMGKAMSESLLLKTKNTGSYYNAFDFAAGALIQNEDPEFSDDKRVATINYSTKVRPFELGWNFGASYGGVAADNGLNGGTLKVGYYS